MTQDIGPDARAYRVEYRMRGHWLYAHVVARDEAQALDRGMRRFHQAGAWRLPGGPVIEAKKRSRKRKTT